MALLVVSGIRIKGKGERAGEPKKPMFSRSRRIDMPCSVDRTKGCEKSDKQIR